MKLSVGIVGLPNVGKSTLFQALTKKAVDIANYPFCTIEPNVGIATVQDARLEKLALVFNPQKTIPAIVEFVDIAGLVRGAAQGEGLGNKFLAHIREAASILHVVRCFEDPEITHVEGAPDPLRDIDCIVESLTPEDENSDIVMRLPGALGNALGPLERGFLFAVQAESGVGKTWWLTYMAQLAVFSGHNVVFFSMEMSTKKMVKRIWQSLTSAPIERHGKLLIPIWDCKKNQIGTCTNGCGVALLKDKLRPSFKDMPRGYKVCTACKGRNDFEPTAWWVETEDPGLLDPNVALRKQAVLDRSGMLRKAGKFKLLEFPNGKYTTEDMVAAVKNLVYYEGIVPGLIVTDYADKFKWAISKDPRVSIGKIWREHKAVAQELNCLMASASQSNTMRSGKQVGRGTWGEAIDKIHELDDGASFNQSSWEKDAGIIRASISKRRHGETVSSSEIMILQSLRTGRPYLDSYLMTAKKEA